MKLHLSPSLLTAGLAALSSLTVAADDMIQIHGSGTTNPSKCLWRLMNLFEERSKLPLRLTYRAVGSSTGIAEFAGVNNTADFAYVPYNDFGSGDVPVPTETHKVITDDHGGMVHLPFVLGAITFFHNIPGVESGPNGLNMTGCLLAKIFKRDIEFWDDDEILAENPHLKDKLPSDNYPIFVARRDKGSSSTASITAYLNNDCSGEWDQVGKEITWEEGTSACQGSGGMTACIRDNPGAIGYIDADHGHKEGLVEIELKNFNGKYLSSRDADIAKAAEDLSTLPSSADADWDGVEFLNKPGDDAWPIVAMSYIFVRKDVSFLTAEEKGLLKLFLETLYNAPYINLCKDFGFTPVPQDVIDIAEAGIGMIDFTGATEWSMEEKTEEGLGHGDYKISSKRRVYGEIVRSANQDDLVEFATRMSSLELNMAEAVISGNGFQTAADEDAKQFTSDDEKQIKAALVLGSLSMCFWALALGYLVMHKCMGI